MMASSHSSTVSSILAPSPVLSSTSISAAATATAAAVTGSLYLPQTYSFLSPETFETLVEGYISQLHVRKRNKALINQQLANDCLMVLTNPENTAIFNPKFRWWVRKHFVFTVVGELRILMDKKNGKPVCVREQLYDKVCYFHHIIGHGGRDKTFAAITKSYSKVPAELVSLFTKNCQTCLGVRKYSKNKRPILNEFEYPSQPTAHQIAQQQHHYHQLHHAQAQQHHHHQQQQQRHLYQLQQQQHREQLAAHQQLKLEQEHEQQQLQQKQQQQQQQQQEQQQRDQQQHHHQLHLTCNTSGFHNSHHAQQQHIQQQQTWTKAEYGTISPISPQMSHSGSGFFSSHHLHSSSSSNGPSAPITAQQQQHHAALASHLNMTLELSDIATTLDDGHHNNPQDDLDASSSACSTPTLLSKLELPLHQLIQHQNQEHAALQQQQHSGLQSPTELMSPDHRSGQGGYGDSSAFARALQSPTLSYDQHSHSHPHRHTSQSHHQPQQQQQSSPASPTGQYSPLYQTNASSQVATQDYSQFSAFSLNSLPPVLSQNQLFQKSVQQEHPQHHQFRQQQQQHKFLSDSLMSSALTSTTTSAVPSAVPALTTTSGTVTEAIVSSIATAAAAVASSAQQYRPSQSSMSSIPTPNSVMGAESPPPSDLSLILDGSCPSSSDLGNVLMHAHDNEIDMEEDEDDDGLDLDLSSFRCDMEQEHRRSMQLVAAAAAAAAASPSASTSSSPSASYRHQTLHQRRQQLHHQHQLQHPTIYEEDSIMAEDSPRDGEPPSTPLSIKYEPASTLTMTSPPVSSSASSTKPMGSMDAASASAAAVTLAAAAAAAAISSSCSSSLSTSSNSITTATNKATQLQLQQLQHHHQQQQQQQQHLAEVKLHMTTVELVASVVGGMQ